MTHLADAAIVYAMHEFSSVAILTAAYLGWFYVLMLYQAYVKATCLMQAKKDGERFDIYQNDNRYMRRADRSMLNMLEQMPAFLTSLWLHAVFVDIPLSIQLGYIYLGFRMLYVFLYPVHGPIIPIIFVSTVPNYIVILYFLVQTVLRVW